MSSSTVLSARHESRRHAGGWLSRWAWGARWGKAGDLGHRAHLFGYILAYRWLSLLPALLGLLPLSEGGAWGGSSWALLAAAGLSGAITAFHPWLNRVLVRKPLLLAGDVFCCSALVSLTGGLRSPYHLYALSPLFAAGLFFRLRGAMLAAGGLASAYGLAAVWDAHVAGGAFNVALLGSHVAGFFLIAGLFARFASALEDQRAAAQLLQQIRSQLVWKTAELQRANRDLRSLHNLAVALQSAAVDVRDVQRRVLLSLTEEFGYPRALAGLVDGADLTLTGWMGARRGQGLDDTVCSTARVPLGEDGVVAEVFREQAPRLVEGGLFFPGQPPVLGDPPGRCALVPLLVREVPVGLLVVEVDGDFDPKASLPLLASVAHQTALALWSTRLCVERAQRSAVQEERSRIARDIHDTVSQCLFGTVYTLESCLRLVPEGHVLRDRLEQVLRVSSKTMAEIRRLVFDMWIGGMTTSEFVTELRSHLEDLGKPESLEVEISVAGDLTELTPFTRKHLFRIAQEALANVVRHAQATRAGVHLAADAQVVRLVVWDNGVGFSPETATQGMGLAGMRERALAIGGTLAVHSVPGTGTTVEVRVPRLACVTERRFAS